MGFAHGLLSVGRKGKARRTRKQGKGPQARAWGSVLGGARGIAMRETQPQRNVILAAGTLAAMGTSCIYMWSIFNKPLMATYGFSASEVSMAYSLFLLTTCFSSMLAGWLQQRIQPRYIVVCSGVLFGMGWFLSGFASNLVMLYLFFGGFAGAGNGLLYNTIVAVVMKWFPDKRGFANGICIGAIGLGPVFFAPLGNFLIESFSVQMAFHIVGVIWLVIYLTVSWLLLVPPAGWQPGTITENREEQTEEKPCQELNLSATQMFRQPLYYVLFLVMMVASTSGLMITAHASNIGQELAGLTASEGAVMDVPYYLGNHRFTPLPKNIRLRTVRPVYRIRCVWPKGTVRLCRLNPHATRKRLLWAKDQSQLLAEALRG